MVNKFSTSKQAVTILYASSISIILLAKKSGIQTVFLLFVKSLRMGTSLKLGVHIVRVNMGLNGNLTTKFFLQFLASHIKPQWLH